MNRYKIKGYRLVFDAMGELPIVSLQHPERENEDAIIMIDLKNERTAEVINELEEIDKLEYGIYITGRIDTIYDAEKDMTFATDLRIEKVEIEDEAEEGKYE